MFLKLKNDGRLLYPTRMYNIGQSAGQTELGFLRDCRHIASLIVVMLHAMKFHFVSIHNLNDILRLISPGVCVCRTVWGFPVKTVSDTRWVRDVVQFWFVSSEFGWTYVHMYTNMMSWMKYNLTISKKSPLEFYCKNILFCCMWSDLQV